MIEKAEKFLEFNPERERIEEFETQKGFQSRVWGLILYGEEEAKTFERERVGPHTTVTHSSAESLRTKERVWGRQPVVG